MCCTLFFYLFFISNVCILGFHTYRTQIGAKATPCRAAKSETHADGIQTTQNTHEDGVPEKYHHVHGHKNMPRMHYTSTRNHQIKQRIVSRKHPLLLRAELRSVNDFFRTRTIELPDDGNFIL